ncbi:MAG TPA: ATP-binding cassette domain-containing protein [Thermoanaerobaculia bacterium]
MTLVIENLVLPLAHFDLEVTATMSARVTAIFGPSGAGKTSLLDAIAGLRPLQKGRILFDDVVLSDLPARDRRIGYVPQETALFPHLSVARNIRYGGRHDEQHVIDVLEIGHLLDRGVTKLSGGEQKRVALARALLSAPRLLLLDEPMAGLDRALRERILPFLQRVRDDLGVPMLYVTHDQEELSAIADAVITLGRHPSPTIPV